ncbi:VOC family protein [Aquimarina muelleri]|uniref:Glyoxalase n=1 Tax=Aquimarina muelleri TaxID=279356 RepID=A0A918JYM5_9FLAO|nr:VOC family protein [Aquimarina muelleri]MCX2765032.1 VOC family protein [Aquimarina muelleri]GGX35095.1 glyoxalase [Aquimarina muelleri]
MKKYILYTAIILSLSITACNNQNKSKETITVQSNLKTKQMKSHISIFEIPATDISRAVNFYQAILGINIEKMEMLGMEMGIFPYEEQMVTGVIMKGEGYKPSANGVTIYLNGGDNLETILNKVEKNGGKILMSKTAHADENGFFALFLDTEGNRLGLNSPN